MLYRKKRILFLILLFLFTYTFSQNRLQLIDSLKKELPTLINKEKIFAIEKIVKNYSFENIDSSLFYNKLMLEISKKIKHDSLIIYSYNLKGDILHQKEEFSASIIAYNTALSLNTSYDKLNAYSNNGVANNYTSLENFEEATTIYLKTLDQFIKVKDTFMIIGTQLHLANNFRKLKDFLSAEKYYQKAIDFNNSKNEILENFLHNNLADLYNDMEKPNLSIQNAEKALTYFEKKNFKKYAAYSIYNKAVAYDKLGENILAENNYLEAIKIHKKHNNNYELANSYSSLGKFYLKLKKYNNAIEISKKAVVSSNIVNSNEFKILSYKNLAEAYKGVKNYNKSFSAFEKYDSLNNNFYKVNKLKITKKLSVQYQTEKKEKELLQTKADKATTELKLTNQKQLTYSLISGFALLILLGFGIFQRNKRKHQLAIANQKEENLQSIIFAEEKERTKIARDLHDGIVQQIGATILKSRNTFKKLGLSEKTESKELLTALETSNAELRSISHQMMPRVLEEAGLIMALKTLFKNSLQPQKINFNFEHTLIILRLPKNIEITLYRITQELLNNILKHSKATKVEIQLFENDNHIFYMFEDNGVGFSASSTSTKTKGIGLKNIQSRIDLIKGSVQFNSENSGSLTTIKIPL